MPDWKPDLDARLRALHDEGLTFEAIGDHMGTTREAVRSRWRRLQANTGAWESKARIENEQPWEPLPGMTKRRCARCSFWFAAAQATGLCPECVSLERRGR